MGSSPPQANLWMVTEPTCAYWLQRSCTQGVCCLVCTGVSAISAEPGLCWELLELAGMLHDFLLILLLCSRAPLLLDVTS